MYIVRSIIFAIFVGIIVSEVSLAVGLVSISFYMFLEYIWQSQAALRERLGRAEDAIGMLGLMLQLSGTIRKTEPKDLEKYKFSESELSIEEKKMIEEFKNGDISSIDKFLENRSLNDVDFKSETPIVKMLLTKKLLRDISNNDEEWSDTIQ